MPDAPGLELILAEINREHPGAVLDTVAQVTSVAVDDTGHAGLANPHPAAERHLHAR